MKPNKIVAGSIHRGLAALVRVARNQRNHHLVKPARMRSKRRDPRAESTCESIERIWLEAREAAGLKTRGGRRVASPLSFLVIQNQEHNLRKLFLQFVWYSTVRFGNKEFKRVYRWTEGTIGPLNSLLNFAGAVLRELAITRYPLPKPKYYQVRVYADGTRRILPRRAADRIGGDHPVKTYWRAGYRGTSKEPLVLLSHPTLPSLDFVDMIRAHIVELCRQCFIQNVPVADSHRYIRLLVHRLRPFLDYVYTEGRVGRSRFIPDADRELRSVVLEIRARYGRRAGRTESITKRLDEDAEFSDAAIELVRNKAMRYLATSDDKEGLAYCKDLLNQIDRGAITDRDVEILLGQMTTLARSEGNDWHRVLLSEFDHPDSVPQLVFHGDRMLHEPSDTLIVAEVPVADAEGIGQLDLVVAFRRTAAGQTVWTPVALFELKTKISVDFNFYSTKARSKTKTQRVGISHIWKRPMDEDEWKRTANGVPSERAQAQLISYERVLLQAYREAVPADRSAPTELLKGVVVVDTAQEYADVVPAMKHLIRAIASKPTALGPSPFWTCVCTESEAIWPRVSLILAPSGSPRPLVQETAHVAVPMKENPFESRKRDGLTLTLYVPVASPTSGGQSAAWISKNWHLLHHIHECVRFAHRPTQVVWLDLLGDLTDDELMRRRLRLDRLRAERQASRRTCDRLVSAAESIIRIDLSHATDILTRQDPQVAIDSLQRHLGQNLIEPAEGEELIIVVDGWTELNEMVPTAKRHLLQTFEESIIRSLPSRDTNVIWVDSGVPHTRMSSTYQRRCVRPLPHDSFRCGLVDEIIYNEPVYARRYGSLKPWRYDYRVIVQDTPTSAEPWKTMIHVPLLHDWARVFAGLSGARKTVSRLQMSRVRNPCPMYGRGISLSSISADAEPYTDQILAEALSLVPSLCKEREDEGGSRLPTTSPVPRPALTVVGVAQSPMPSLMARARLAPQRPPPQLGRLRGRYLAVGNVTRPRRSYTRKNGEDEGDRRRKRVTRKPPLTDTTVPEQVDTRETRLRELVRLKRAAELLLNHVSLEDPMSQICESIVSECREALDGPRDSDSLGIQLREIYKGLLLKREIRDAAAVLAKRRQELGEVLNIDNRHTLAEVKRETPDVLLLYGTNLLLGVLCSSNEVFGSPVSPVLEDLWSAVAEWELYQMGFRPDLEATAPLKPVYDFPTIYANLLRRARILRGMTLVTSLSSEAVFGQLIPLETSDRGLDTWLVIPGEGGQRAIAGLFNDKNQIGLREWNQAVTNPDTLRESAARALGRDEERTPVALNTVDGHRLLWILTEQPDGEKMWWVKGVFEYPTHVEAEGLAMVPWVRISSVPPELHSMDERSVPGAAPRRLDQRVDNVLRQFSSLNMESENVRCEVSVDRTRSVYTVRLVRADDRPGVPLHTYETASTHELARFLRIPVSNPWNVRSNDGRVLLWDHMRSVEYGSVRAGTGRVSLAFLKPLVLRSRFHQGEYAVPETCDELLGTVHAGRITMIVESPAAGSGAQWQNLRVRFKGLSEVSRLKGLEAMPMNIYDVALLSECGGLFDVERSEYRSMEVELSDLGGLRAPASLEESNPAFHEMLVDAGQGGNEETSGGITDLDECAEPNIAYGSRLKLLDVELLVGRGGVRDGAKVVARFRSTESEEGAVEIVLIESVQRLRDMGPTQQEGLEEHLHRVLEGLDISDADRTKTVRKALSVLRGLRVRLV